MRTSFSGCFLINSLRIIWSTFIDWLAQSIRFFPISARSRFLISQLTCRGIVGIRLLWRVAVLTGSMFSTNDQEYNELGVSRGLLMTGWGDRYRPAYNAGYFRLACATGSCLRPASLASLAALSVVSQVKSGSLRPK